MDARQQTVEAVETPTLLVPAPAAVEVPALERIGTPEHVLSLQRTAGNVATNRALRRAVAFGRARRTLALMPRAVARTPAATEERDGGVDGGVAGVAGPVEQEADGGVAATAHDGNAAAAGAVGGGSGSVGGDGGTGSVGTGGAGNGDGGAASSSRATATVTPPVAGETLPVPDGGPPPGPDGTPLTLGSSELKDYLLERSRHDQWGAGGGGALSDEQTSELVGDALLGGAAGGVVSGAGAFVVDTALNVAAKRIPYGSGFIAMGQMFTAGGPAAWWQAQSEATGYAAISGAAGLFTGHDVDGKQLDWVERCEQALNALDGLNNILSLLSTILFIVAAAGFVLSFVFPPIAAFLPLIVQWALLLGNLNSAIGVVLTLARLALMGIRVYQIKYEQADPAMQAKRAAALRKTTQQFSQELTLRWANKGRTAAEKKWGGGPQAAPAPDERSGTRKALGVVSTVLTGADVGEGFKGVSEANTRRTEIAGATAKSTGAERLAALSGLDGDPVLSEGTKRRLQAREDAVAAAAAADKELLAQQAAFDAEHGGAGTTGGPRSTLADSPDDQARSFEIRASVKQQQADAIKKHVAGWDEHIAKAEAAGDEPLAGKFREAKARWQADCDKTQAQADAASADAARVRLGQASDAAAQAREETLPDPGREARIAGGALRDDLKGTTVREELVGALTGEANKPGVGYGQQGTGGVVTGQATGWLLGDDWKGWAKDLPHPKAWLEDRTTDAGNAAAGELGAVTGSAEGGEAARETWARSRRAETVAHRRTSRLPGPPPGAESRLEDSARNWRSDDWLEEDLLVQRSSAGQIAEDAAREQALLRQLDAAAAAQEEALACTDADLEATRDAQSTALDQSQSVAGTLGQGGQQRSLLDAGVSAASGIENVIGMLPEGTVSDPGAGKAGAKRMGTGTKNAQELLSSGPDAEARRRAAVTAFSSQTDAATGDTSAAQSTLQSTRAEIAANRTDVTTGHTEAMQSRSGVDDELADVRKRKAEQLEINRAAYAALQAWVGEHRGAREKLEADVAGGLDETQFAASGAGDETAVGRVTRPEPAGP